MTRYWIGVASKDHVLKGMAGGFAQLCHGKNQPLKRMSQGDILFYYAPKETFASQTPCQKIIACGRVIGQETYPYEMAPGFIPYRRDLSFASIKRGVPLSVLNQQKEWLAVRSQLRYGHFEIPKSLADFLILALGIL